ncbi:TonB-dependent receptor plug domain-containing protein [Hymenobacter monticola]|uniref:TonB-dependent receptor n=1 Tax=Hymenobacter monticola TaxID=1705399 RepID=A0ABY4B2Z5_9BACT|nr:TonB-dependent receptor [Hymenobacter monticola]UOE33515.1 TonB-dependent receptor [Hymenobacter monticola]
MRLTRYATPLFCSFIAYNSLAQTPADSARSLREVTVFASRLTQPSNQTGHAVTVISGASVARYPVNSIDDLLRCLPALEIQSRGSFGAQADVSMRGSTFNQVLFLLDGMRLNDPLTGHFGAYMPITPAEIEQIEIIRGAGAALYGPDAVGGVINIVTKTFAATERRHEAELTSTTMRGEYNLWHTNTGGFLASGKLRLGGGILLNKTDGQLRDYPGTQRSDVDLKTYSLSAAYELTPKLSAAARASLDRRDYSAQYFYTTAIGDLSRETTNKDWYQGQLRYQHNERARTEAQVSTSRSTDYYLYTPTSVASDHLTRYTNVLLSHQQQFTDKLRATLGGQADHRSVVSNDRGNHDQWHYAAFGVVALTPTAGLALTGGLRLDHDQAYGTEVVPQLNVSQQIGEELTVRGAIGRAIRAPDFTERYNANGRAGTVPSGFNVGNAGLQAERTMNYEAGADYRSLPGFTVKATGFLRKGNNQIDYVPTPGARVIEASGLTNLNPAATYRYAQNLFDVTTRGLETELVYQRQFSPTTRFDGSVGYMLVKVSNADNIASQYLANIARQVVSGTVSLTSKRVNGSLSGLWKQRDASTAAAINRTNNAEYTVFNARLEVALLPQRLWLTGQVQNLFNEKYSDLLGAQMPTRWLMGGLRLALRK